MTTEQMHMTLLKSGYQVQVKRIGGYWIPFIIDLSVEDQESVNDPVNLDEALGINDNFSNIWAHSEYWTDYYTVFNSAVEYAYKNM